MKKVPLSNSDKFAIVDDEDFERINKHKWTINSFGYARRSGKKTISINPPIPLLSTLALVKFATAAFAAFVCRQRQCEKAGDFDSEPTWKG